MISPTGSAMSPSTPTVSSRPGTKRSIITSSSYLAASSIAGARSARFFTTVSPTVDPCFDGLTTTGRLRIPSTCSIVAGAISQSAVFTSAARNSRFERSLSIANALARCPLPVYFTCAMSSSAWIVPSSPWPPCSARKTTSASLTSFIDVRFGRKVPSANFESDSSDGGSVPTFPVLSARSSLALITPRAGSSAVTSCPRSRNALVIRIPDASETLRSEDVPPMSTVIFIRSIFPLLARHHEMQHIGSRHDSLHYSVLLHQDCWVCLRQQLDHAVYWLIRRHHREG